MRLASEPIKDFTYNRFPIKLLEISNKWSSQMNVTSFNVTNCQAPQRSSLTFTIWHESIGRCFGDVILWRCAVEHRKNSFPLVRISWEPEVTEQSRRISWSRCWCNPAVVCQLFEQHVAKVQLMRLVVYQTRCLRQIRRRDGAEVTTQLVWAHLSLITATPSWPTSIRPHSCPIWHSNWDCHSRIASATVCILPVGWHIQRMHSINTSTTSPRSTLRKYHMWFSYKKLMHVNYYGVR